MQGRPPRGRAGGGLLPSSTALLNAAVLSQQLGHLESRDLGQFFIDEVALRQRHDATTDAEQFADL